VNHSVPSVVAENTVELSLCSTRTVLGLMVFGRFTEVVLVGVKLLGGLEETHDCCFANWTVTKNSDKTR